MFLLDRLESESYFNNILIWNMYQGEGKVWLSPWNKSLIFHYLEFSRLTIYIIVRVILIYVESREWSYPYIFVFSYIASSESFPLKGRKSF